MTINPIARLLLAVFLWHIAADAAADDFRTEIAQMLRRESLVGAACSLLPGDGAVTVAAAGLSNADTREPMTQNKRLLVGSIAKVVLGTGILRLASEGRLSLDTPVTELLPELDFHNPWAPQSPVRVRHLLAHTAGLENLRLWQAFSLEAEVDTPLAETLGRDPSQLRIRTRPGDQYLYSNSGYALLGMVIEAVTGERYEEYLDKNLLHPLSMHDSSFGFVSQTGAYADKHLAMGHFEKGRTQSAMPTYLRPAGQFVTTARDMARFARFLMSNGRVRGEIFIHPDLLGTIGWPNETEAERAGLAIGHGLALAVRDRHGVVGLCHPGTTIGFRAMLCLYPQENKAFFIAHNADSEHADYEGFNRALIERLQLRLAPEAAETEAAFLPAEWAGFYIPDPVGIEAFSWVDTVFNFVEVRAREQRLLLKPFQSDTKILAPVGGLLYRAEDRKIPSHILFKDARGQQTLSTGLRSYKRIPAAGLALLWLSLGLGLLGIFYIFVAGSVRLLSGKAGRCTPLLIPFWACLALLLPVPFFYFQSFLQLGDITVASVLLALATGALPAALLAGLVVQYRRGSGGVWGVLDTSAMIFALQWAIALAAFGMLPIRLWA